MRYICLRNANKAEPTLALKPRGDITRNPKQGCQWPQNRTCECVQQKKTSDNLIIIFLAKEIWNCFEPVRSLKCMSSRVVNQSIQATNHRFGPSHPYTPAFQAHWSETHSVGMWGMFRHAPTPPTAPWSKTHGMGVWGMSPTLLTAF